MREITRIEAFKIISIIILFMITDINGSAQSPYAMFGDNSVMLDAKSEPAPEIYRVVIQQSNGASLYADFNLNRGIATLYDTAGNELLQDSISETAKALFMSIDPHAENYYNLSPYNFCGSNPINAIDPDGRDYWSTNDRDQIFEFLNAVGSGNTQFDFSKWNHATDAEICGNLVYNDESQKFYTSYAKVTNGEVVVSAKTFDANITPVSTTGIGYPGAFVYEPINGFWQNIDYFLNGLTYNNGLINWNVDRNGRIVGAAPLIGIPPIIGRKGGKLHQKMGIEKGNMSGNRMVQREQFEHLSKKYNLSDKEKKILHDYIHDEGLGYHELERAIIDLFRR